MSARAIVVWGGLSLAAVVAITAAVTKKIVTDRWAAEHPVAVAEAEAPAAATEVPAQTVVATVVAATEPVTGEPAAPVAEVVEPVEVAVLANVNLETLVGSMTAEQREKLEGEARKAEAHHQRLAARHRMPSDVLFYSLELAGRGKPELRLTDEQRRQLKAIEDGERELLSARLSGVWARMDEIYGQYAAEGNAGAMGGPALMTQGEGDSRTKELSDLYKQEAAAKDAFDGDYELKRTAVLNEEQRKYVSDRKAEFARFMKAGQ